MYFLKRCIMCALAIMLMISLLGCTSIGKKAETIKKNLPGEYSVSGDRLSLDTTIDTPPENIDEITVTPYEVNAGKAKEMFLRNIKKQDNDMPNEMGEDYEDDNGNLITFHKKSGIVYYSDFYWYVSNCFREEPIDSDYNMDKYSTEKEFEFMSRKEALKVIDNKLKKIGIDLGDIEYHCYSLDHKTLKKEEYKEDMDGNEDTSSYKNQWTKEDDCYYFCIRQKHNGITEYHKEFNTAKEYDDAYSSIRALVSIEGIKFLQIEYALKFQDTGKKIKIVNPQQILDKVSYKYGKIIGGQTYTIDSFNLCYMTNPANNYAVTPIYQCHILEKGRDDSIIKNRVIQLLFDATTGEELE